jgi:CubicO group peptidase (beta-lactamase class C family)
MLSSFPAASSSAREVSSAFHSGRTTFMPPARRRISPTSGTRVVYSDLGFITLGEVVAAVTAMPFDAAVRTLVTGPLGLTATRFRPNGAAGCFAATERRADGTADAAAVQALRRAVHQAVTARPP